MGSFFVSVNDYINRVIYKGQLPSGQTYNNRTVKISQLASTLGAILALGLLPLSEAMATSSHAGVTTPANWSPAICAPCHDAPSFLNASPSQSVTVTYGGTSNGSTLGYYAASAANIVNFLNTAPAGTNASSMGVAALSPPTTVGTADLLSAYIASSLTPLITNSNVTTTFASGATLNDTISGTSGSDYLVNTTTYTAQLCADSVCATPITSGSTPPFSGFTVTPNSASPSAAIHGTLPTVSAPTTYHVHLTATNPNNSTAGVIDYTITVNPPAPVITGGTVTAKVGTLFSYSNYATNTPTACTASPLPSGLAVTLSSSQCSIGGTPLTGATSTATSLGASNPLVGTSQTLNIVVAPEITSSLTANATSGTLFSYSISATNTTGAINGTVSYSTSTLPSWLSLTGNTISGTPAAGTATASPYTIAIGATNNTNNAGATKNLVITVAPEVTSSTTASAVVGTAYTTGAPVYTVTANNVPTAFSAPNDSGTQTVTVGGVTATGLPQGLSIDSSGRIIGTPTDAPGTYTVSISASNAAGSGATKTLTLSLYGFTSATSANATAGAFTYTISAFNNSTSSCSETGTLPTGLSLTGCTISGTPTINGVYTFSVTANGTPTLTQSVTITVASVPPVVTNAPTASCTAGQLCSFQLTGTNTPTIFNLSTLPSGLTLDPTGTTHGLITGTPTQQGIFNVTESVANGAGTSPTVTLVITIDTVTPVITSALTTINVQTGVALSPTYQITASNFPSPTGFSATGLPQGLSVSPAGVISGTPTGPLGAVSTTINASNSTNSGTVHTGSATLPFNVTLGPPVITGLSNLSGTGGVAFNSQINASNTVGLASSVTYSITSGALPGGLSLNASTGAITGTPTATGSFPVTFSVNNGTATVSSSATINIGLPTSVPSITSGNSASGSGGAAFSYQVVATNVPTNFVATGLPPGLSISSSGLISGTPTVNGVFNISVTASNGIGSSTPAKVMTLTLTATAPTIASTASTAGTGGGAFSYQVTANFVPTSYSASGLPAGLSINSTTGLITGTSTVSGTFIATVTVANSAGSATQTLTITLNTVAPVINSVNTATGIVSSSFSYQITAANLPTSFSAIALPPGLSLATSTGLISGKPTRSGTYPVTLAASNSAGSSANMTLTITVGVLPPTVTAASMTLNINTSKTLDLAPFITGSAVTGVRIMTSPLHGTVITNATQVTYTPKQDYFGIDTFSYVAYGVAGVSPNAATVTVTIQGRPDPTKDTRVTGIVTAQTAAVMHFGTVQVFNFQQRLESRHHAVYSSPSSNTDSMPSAPPTDTPIPAVNAPGTPSVAPSLPAGDVSNSGSNTPSSSGDSPAPNDKPKELAPAPASGSLPGQNFNSFNSWNPNSTFSLTNDPNALLHTLDSTNNGRPGDTNPVTSLVANLVTGLAASTSLNLGSISSAIGAVKDDSFSKVDLWAAGNIRFGTSTYAGVDTRFATDGVSFGADSRLSRKLTMGMGMGYAVDNSSIGTDGTYSHSTGVSLAGYGTYQWDAGTFLDGMLGYGKINFDTNRYVPALDDFARAARTGDQIFGSLAFGYDYRDEALVLSPYGRYDFSYDRLDQGTETGAGSFALSYDKQKVQTSSLSLGLRTQSAHQTDFGLIQPHARVELQHSIESVGDTSVAYADLLGTQYGIAGTTQSINSLVLGIGSDFIFSSSLKMALDYERHNSPGTESFESINFRLNKTLNGKNEFESLMEESYNASITKPSGLMVSAGLAYDSNVTRASDSQDIRSDTIYSVSASKAITFTVSKFTRLKLSGFIDTEEFRTYTGLGHISGGGEGEFMYRTSGDFGAPTFGIFARFTDDAYESTLRDGTRGSAGVTWRQPLSDRISMFAAVAGNERQTNTEVFNTKDVSVRTNFDYAIDIGQTLYFTGEYRKGDIVSTGQGTLKALDMAAVTTPDDVFRSPQFQDYRMKGKTGLLTLGYNLSLGTKDSLDFSWRGVRSTPDYTPAYATPASYLDNQYSIAYLMVF